MMALCLSAGGAVVTLLQASVFTLAWTHSVERVRWEEDWHAGADGLTVVSARIRGSGAGMEPPPGAEWREGWWHYRPALAPQPGLTLALSDYAGDYTLCAEGTCRTLGALLGEPRGAWQVQLYPCPGE